MSSPQQEKKALVVIPTYNEIDNVERMIRTVLGLPRAIDVLIVDDNSPDGTAEAVKRSFGDNDRVSLLEREGKQGLGTAYVAGFKFALERDYAYVLEMDCDFSHNPHDLVKLLDAAGSYDLAVGSRYIRGVNVVNWPLNRLLLSLCASLYTRVITGLPLKDPTSGFKCYRRAVLEAIDLDTIRSNGYSFQIEMHYRTWQKHFRIKEVPIVFTERVDGVSKMGKEIVREAIYIVWTLRFPWLAKGRAKA
jgi:dolichol-phosphate mannosyltransferase